MTNVERAENEYMKQFRFRDKIIPCLIGFAAFALG